MNESEKELARIAKLSSTRQQIELAAFISSLFEKHDVDMTVVGGAAVQYYTDSEYVTGDLDAVLQGDTKEIVESVMSSLGFKRTRSYRHFEHPSFPFVIEFPPSPIEVAGRRISKLNLLRIGSYQVRVIRVEDIIMDRITAGVEWKDKPSLEQAKLLWKKNKDVIDKKYLTEFAEKEGYLRVLKEVMSI